MKRVAAVGECMLELRHLDRCGLGGTLAMAAAGDSYNTAVYLKRSAGSGVIVSYVTVLGEDPYSDELLAAMASEELDTSLVRRVPDRLPGAYFVRIDEAGERSFLYYRSHAAARLLFTSPETSVGELAHAGLVYLTGITLAIMSDDARSRLREVLEEVRAHGGSVAFDVNYRPALWPDALTAQRTVREFMAYVDIAFPGLDDAAALWGDQDAASIEGRFQEAGVSELVLKQGDAGVRVCKDRQTFQVEAAPVDHVVDTTAAGDAFNGAYLAARLRGADPAAAAREGTRLAAAVIQEPGAIAARSGGAVAPRSGGAVAPRS